MDSFDEHAASWALRNPQVSRMWRFNPAQRQNDESPDRIHFAIEILYDRTNSIGPVATWASEGGEIRRSLSNFIAPADFGLSLFSADFPTIVDAVGENGVLIFDRLSPSEARTVI